MKKLILLGLILAVGVVRIPAAWSASYPTGQATVTLVTPFNGIPHYSGYEQKYVNEWSSRAAWGYPLDNVKWTAKASVGAIKASTGSVATKTATLVVGKAASASLVAVAVQAGLMIGATYFGDWLEQETLELWGDPPVVVDPTKVELPPEIPQGAQYWWDGTSGMGVGSTYCGPPALCCEFQVVGFYTSYAAAQSACTAAKGSQCGYGALGNYSYCGGSWSGWSSVQFNTGYQTPTKEYVYTTDGSKHSHIVSVSELGAPVPLTAEEMRDRIEAAFDSGNSTRQQTAMEMAQGSLAAVAPYINESNKNFPTSRETSPSGSPSLTPSQVAEAQDALDDSIDPSDKADVEDQNATAPVGENDWEYTPQEMAKAQFDMDKKLDQERKAEYDSYENAVPTYDSNATIPEKDSITTKLETFMNSLSGSGGVVDTLEGMKEVQLTNASCSISADLGEWGSLEFSFCEWESVVSAFGSIMLMVCSFLWVAWFFMGRGDA